MLFYIIFGPSRIYCSWYLSLYYFWFLYTYSARNVIVFSSLVVNHRYTYMIYSITSHNSITPHLHLIVSKIITLTNGFKEHRVHIVWVPISQHILFQVWGQVFPDYTLTSLNSVLHIPPQTFYSVGTYTFTAEKFYSMVNNTMLITFHMQIYVRRPII